MLHTMNMMSGVWDEERAALETLSAERESLPLPALQLQLRAEADKPQPTIRDFVLPQSFLSCRH